jgi:hypothetical protein
MLVKHRLGSHGRSLLRARTYPRDDCRAHRAEPIQETNLDATPYGPAALPH